MNDVKCSGGRAACTLVHLSDFHHCRPSGVGVAAFRNKRLLSLLSWRLRRRKEHRPELLDRMSRAVAAEAADAVAVTGDLTHLCLPVEFDEVRERLGALGPPQRVFVVPGNHDALVPVPWDKGLGRWAEFMAPDSSRDRGRFDFPALRVREPLALIGISTARPTRPLSATGRVGEAQLERLEEILHRSARMKLFRVLLIHHPPAAGMVSRRKALEDADRFAAVIRRTGAELILHGHCHRLCQAELDGPRAPIPVLGVSSATATAAHPLKRAAFRRICVGGSAPDWRIEVHDHVI
jgi:3',5'-cyclic AMP phosphodiesterase CpdA